MSIFAYLKTTKTKPCSAISEKNNASNVSCLDLHRRILIKFSFDQFQTCFFQNNKKRVYAQRDLIGQYPFYFLHPKPPTYKCKANKPPIISIQHYSSLNELKQKHFIRKSDRFRKQITNQPILS